MLGMQRKLIVAFLAAFVAFFGAMTVAQAAPKSSLPSNPVAGPAVAGTFAARYGAPMCDDRAASSYAAEPRAPEVDGGTVEATPEGGARALSPCRSSLSTAKSGSPVPDDALRAPTHVARDVATLPIPVIVPAPVGSELTTDRAVSDGARDGHPQGDSPPPKPIPWRR
jgi:hypothetical protein